MEWAIALLALALVLGLMVARAVRDRSARPRTGARAPQDALAPQDESDLAREFAAVEEELGATRQRLLARRLEVLRTRQIPLRAVRPAPGPRTGRLVFADGTVVIARARRPGELYVMAVQLHDHAVCLESFTAADEGTVLRMVWPPEGSAELVALGLDQAD